MIDGSGPELSERIAQRGREVVVGRLRDAFAHQAETQGGGADVDPTHLERLVQEAAANAGEALWRRSLAEAVMEELGVDLPGALAHPLLGDAHELIDAQCGAPVPSAGARPEPPTSVDGLPAPDAELPEGQPSRPGDPDPFAAAITDPDALRLSVVHLSGIDTLHQGDDDLELRLSSAGLDVLRRSTGAAVGRLEWSEINTVALPKPKRRLRTRRRSHELQVSTGRGDALFELPELTDDELHEHLEPALARLTGTGTGAAARPRTGAPPPDMSDSHADPAGSPAEVC